MHKFWFCSSTVAGLVGGSGVRARKVQIKAQTAEAPKKLFALMKKKFKRKKKGEQGNEENLNDSKENPDNGDAESSSSDDSSDRSGTNVESDDIVKEVDALSEGLEDGVTITRL